MTAAVIYLDYAATAPIAPQAAAAMNEATRWANPSSVHAAGRTARAALETARRDIALALGWDGEVILTSGATEALALALSGPGARIVSAVEHAAVIGAAARAVVAPVDGDGRVDLTALERLVPAAGRGARVAVQQVNNETGVVQPVADVARIVGGGGAVFVCDAVQGAARAPLADADLIAVSAHKLGGPSGIGALLVRDLRLLTVAGGGGQERGYRAGTENLIGAAGFAAALAARAADAGWTARVGALRARLEARLTAAGGLVVASDAERADHIICVAQPGAEAMVQLIALDLEGFCVSAGAACSSGRVKASHVLTAMGWSERAAGEAIRVSIGWDTTGAEVDAFADAYVRMAGRLGRKVAA